MIKHGKTLTTLRTLVKPFSLNALLYSHMYRPFIKHVPPEWVHHSVHNSIPSQVMTACPIRFGGVILSAIIKKNKAIASMYEILAEQQPPFHPWRTFCNFPVLLSFFGGRRSDLKIARRDYLTS